MKFFLKDTGTVILDPTSGVTHTFSHLTARAAPVNSTSTDKSLVEASLPHTSLRDTDALFITNDAEAYTDEVLGPLFDQISRLSQIGRSATFLKELYSAHKASLLLSKKESIGYVGLYPLPGTKFYVLEFILNPTKEIARPDEFNFFREFFKSDIGPGGEVVTVGYTRDIEPIVLSMGARVLDEPPEELILALMDFYPDIFNQKIYLHP